MLKRIFTFSPNLGIAMGTVLFLLIVGSAYFLAYIPNNKKNLEEKQFRCLQNVEHNLLDKINNSLALLNNLARKYDEGAKDQLGVAVAAYANRYPSQDFKLRADTKYVRPAGGTDTAITIKADTISIEIKTKGAKFSMSYTFKQFMDPLLPRDIFDNYIILNKTNVIYQTFPSGLTQFADTLINNKGAFVQGPVRDVSLSGTSYKLFLQQFNIKTATPIGIAGLLTSEHYGEEKNKLPETVVLFLLLIAIAGILAFPWIKLYQMGSQDRMTASDGLFCLTVPMLLMSILFFAFLSYNISFRFGPRATELTARTLAENIQKRFVKEIDTTYQVLQQAAGIYSSTPYTVTDTQAHARLRTISRRVLVNQIYQLNSKGIEIRNWTPDAPPPPLGDYSNRQYYIHLKEHHAFLLGQDQKKPYYIDQVTSWTTAGFTTIMAIPSADETPPYTAISFKIKCLNQAILTPGFIYSIIDETGKVLYHSNPGKQLNENLFEEFSEHQTLKNTVSAHSEQYFSTKYSGKAFNVYVSPFKYLPYHLVIMEDKNYTNVREINNFAFSFSMLFGLFLLLAAELLMVFMLSVKKCSYKKHYFDLSWIGPSENFHHTYQLALYGNLATIALLIHWMTSMNLSPFLECLFILLTASCLSFIFLNILYLRAYKQQNNKEQYGLKLKAVIGLIIVLLFCNILAGILTAVKSLLSFELVMIIVLGALFKLSAKSSRTAKKPDSRNFSIRFSLMTFTRMIITSGLPVMLFYISVSNYNIKLITRYRHTEFAKNILANHLLDTLKIKKTSSQLPASPTLELKSTNLYTDRVWIDSPSVVAALPDLPATAGERHANELFRYLTLNNDDLLPGIKALDHVPQDSTWVYSSLFMPGRGVTFYRPDTVNALKMQSARLGYTLPPITWDGQWYKGLSYWLLFFAALAGFWLLLHHVLKRLFALNLPSNSHWEKLDEVMLTDPALNSLLFLIGAPGSGKLNGVITLLADKKIKGMGEVPIILDKNDPNVNGYIADMIQIPNNVEVTSIPGGWSTMKATALDEKNKLVIVNHFEYDIKNPDSNRLKLDFLEELLQKNTSKVFIISTVHPINFLDSLNQQNTDANNDRSPEHDLERWHVLLGHFKIVIQKLTNDSLLSQDYTTDHVWKKTLRYETRRGHFLTKLQKPIIDELDKVTDKKTLDGESLSLKLGITSHYFYMYMWQSLTKEEKFLLYDLAEDGLVNPYDDYNLILLISKGLVTKEYGQLKIFNHGFREFILTAIGNAEAIQIQRQIKDNGNWNKLKIPLIILIMAVLAFLFASQQEAYATLLKYAAIIAAGLPVILKVFSGLSSTNSKTS